MELTSPRGTLPADTLLTVNYNGHGDESYSLATGGAMNSVVCCRTGDPTKGRLPDIRCGVPPAPSSSGPPRPVRDASSASMPDAPASLPRDGAISGARDAMSRATGDAALFIRDGAVAPPREAGIADASGIADSAAPDARPPGPLALLCDLWTDGYAEVTITATGFPNFVYEFIPNLPVPGCGVVTVDRRVELGNADAGASP